MDIVEGGRQLLDSVERKDRQEEEILANHGAIRWQLVVDGISEEAVAKYVLSFKKDCKALMAVAANIKNSKILRCTARIACHQPLFNHIKRMKNGEPSVSVPVSKPLDRLSLSYEIVKMRSFIKQAKVYTMHKLTRNISTLHKKKKMNEEEVKSKEDSIVKKMCCLKELDADDVTKFLFTNTLNLESLISNEKATLKVKIMSMIGKHKVVDGQLADFKSRYPEWSKLVPTLLEQKKKKKKPLLNLKEGGTKVELDKASGKVSKINESENFEDNASFVKINNKDNTVENEVSSNSSVSRTENEFNVMKVKSSNATKKSKSLIKETSSEEESEGEEIDQGSEYEVSESDSEKDTKKETIYKNDKITRLPLQMSLDHVTDKEGDVCPKSKRKQKVQGKNVEGSLNNQSSNSKNIKSNGFDKLVEIAKKKSSAKTKVVDSFFMTKDNKEYLSSQLPTFEDKQTYASGIGKQYDQIDSSKKFDSFGRKEKPSQIRNKRKWSGQEDNWSEKKLVQHKLENSALGSFTKPRLKDALIIGNRKERRKAIYETNNEKIEKLHPSWEAKKKQPSIAQFKGKKIVFD